MLDVQNRLPTPGKENRVKITQDSGAVVEGVLSYADDATQDGTFWNRKNGQLLQGDIRELTIKDGESISAGDVVNVDGGVYYNVTPQANVENLLYSSALSDISLCYLNDNHSIAALKTSANSITDVYIVDNKTGLGRASSRLSSDYHQYVKVAKLSDTKFISLYVGSSAYSKIGTVSSSSISFGSQYTVASSVSNMADVIALSDNLALSIYNSSGLKCKVLPISGTTITTSGTVYSLSSNTGANYISACRLPDDSNGNKRVCICFADTGDGNKGKAVIATIDSNNAVTFGDVETVFNNSVTNTFCSSDNKTILFTFGSNSTFVFYYFTENSLQIATQKANSYNSAGCINLEEGKFLLLSSNYIRVVTFYNGVAQTYPIFHYHSKTYATSKESISKISNKNVIIAFSDNDNSQYGTTTVLEVSGNQIAGSFLDNSKDAIALASGSGGDIIPVGFGGYCQCDGVTEGQQITSDGVSAYSPLDGWLYLLGAGMKRLGTQIVTGSYVGTGTYGQSNPNTLTFDSPPKLVSVYYEFASVPTIGNGFIWVGQTGAANAANFLFSLQGNTLSWYNTTSAASQLNQNGWTYTYCAIL